MIEQMNVWFFKKTLEEVLVRHCMLLALTLSNSQMLLAAPLDLKNQVNAALIDRRFKTKIPIGLTYTYYNQPNRRYLMRWVGTRISHGNIIEYVTYGPDKDPDSWRDLGFSYERVSIGVEEMQSAFPWRSSTQWNNVRAHPSRHVVSPAGEYARIVSTYWKNDRLVLEISVGLADPWLEFIFQEGFQKTYTRDSILRAISRALVLEEFERSLALDDDYSKLKIRLEKARSTYDSSPESDRLKAGEELQQALREMALNRSTKEKLTPGEGEGESARYTKEATEIEPTLVRLRANHEAKQKQQQEEIRLRSIEEVGMKLKDKDRRFESLLIEVTTRKLIGMADWHGNEARLSEARAILDEKAGLYDEWAKLGQARSANEGSRLIQQHDRLKLAHAAQEVQRASLEGQQIEKDYLVMDRKRVSQRNLYTLAFGTPSFEAEANKYVVLLQQMYDNRRQAHKNGSAKAEGQASALQKEISRVKAQIRN